MSSPMTDADITEARIDALVRAFYSKARVDPLLGPVFEAAVDDWEGHFDALGRFWASVMLGTRSYQGRPMQKHMQLPLEPAMFERWLELWSETAGEVFPPETAELFRARARQIGRSLSLGLFFKPDAPASPSV
jgi:hemoglobin